jgi:endonuclease YncB( thermonuclease family)
VLVRCFLPSGEDIAKLALQEGMAWTVDQDGNAVDPAYAQIEDEARQHRRGIWSSNFMRGHNLFRP